MTDAQDRDAERITRQRHEVHDALVAIRGDGERGMLIALPWEATIDAVIAMRDEDAAKIAALEGQVQRIREHCEHMGITFSDEHPIEQTIQGAVTAGQAKIAALELEMKRMDHQSTALVAELQETGRRLLDEARGQCAALRAFAEGHGHCYENMMEDHFCEKCMREEPHHDPGCEYMKLIHDTAAASAAYLAERDARVRAGALNEALDIMDAVSINYTAVEWHELGSKLRALKKDCTLSAPAASTVAMKFARPVKGTPLPYRPAPAAAPASEEKP